MQHQAQPCFDLVKEPSWADYPNIDIIGRVLFLFGFFTPAIVQQDVLKRKRALKYSFIL